MINAKLWPVLWGMVDNRVRNVSQPGKVWVYYFAHPGMSFPKIIKAIIISDIFKADFRNTEEENTHLGKYRKQDKYIAMCSRAGE